MAVLPEDFLSVSVDCPQGDQIRAVMVPSIQVEVRPSSLEAALALLMEAQRQV
jgi:hypothetical protein